MRVIGMDIHRTFAEVAAFEAGKLTRLGRVDMRRALLQAPRSSAGFPIRRHFPPDAADRLLADRPLEQRRILGEAWSDPIEAGSAAATRTAAHTPGYRAVG